MLRCPPTQIRLLPSETADWIRRHDKNKAERRQQRTEHKVRLDNGPRHLAQPGIVSEDDNLGRKRAASCSSEATICSDLDQLDLDPLTTEEYASSAFEDDPHPSLQQTTETTNITAHHTHTTRSNSTAHETLNSDQLLHKGHISSKTLHLTDCTDSESDEDNNQNRLFSLRKAKSPSIPPLLDTEKRSHARTTIPCIPQTDGTPASLIRHNKRPSRHGISNTGSPGRVYSSELYDLSLPARSPGRGSRSRPPVVFPQRTSSRQHLIEYERNMMNAEAKSQGPANSRDSADASNVGSADDGSACDLDGIINIHARNPTSKASPGCFTVRPDTDGFDDFPARTPARRHTNQESCSHGFNTTTQSILMRESPLSELSRCLSEISVMRSPAAQATDSEASSSGHSQSTPVRSSKLPQSASQNRNSIFATPKVPVYNDSLPPEMQPQTPADIPIPRQLHQSLGKPPHSSLASRPTSFLPPGSKGKSPDRPSRAVNLSGSPIEMGAAGPSRPANSSHRAHSTTMHSNSHSETQIKAPVPEDAENEIMARLDQLERDRQTRAHRVQQGANLETTPPREGRFEQYF